MVEKFLEKKRKKQKILQEVKAMHIIPVSYWISGLPDFSWYNIPKWKNMCIPNVHTISQIATKSTKLPQNPPNGFINTQNFHSKAYKNMPKFWFLLYKYTIWQPCLNLWEIFSFFLTSVIALSLVGVCCTRDRIPSGCRVVASKKSRPLFHDQLTSKRKQWGQMCLFVFCQEQDTNMKILPVL
jgi:hypothetical protein